MTDDDIIQAGAGSGGCTSFDVTEDCSSVGSGTEDEIINPVVIVKTTTAAPTTTPRSAVTEISDSEHVGPDWHQKGQIWDFLRLLVITL